MVVFGPSTVIPEELEDELEVEALVADSAFFRKRANAANGVSLFAIARLHSSTERVDLDVSPNSVGKDSRENLFQ